MRAPRHGCVRLDSEASTEVIGRTLVLASRPGRDRSVAPDWVSAGPRWFNGPQLALAAPNLARGGDAEDAQAGLVPIGHGCLAYGRAAWWVVDPVRGELRSTGDSQWVPEAPWIGVAARDDRHLVLASAAQEIVELDLVEQRVTKRFPAPVWPSRRDTYGECSAVGAGLDWYFSYDFNGGRLDVFDGDGHFLRRLMLPEVLGRADPLAITAIAADGPFLGVGTMANGSHVLTRRVVLGPEGCE